MFDALRDQVMQMHSLPSNFADEPWPQGVTCLALAEREYTPPDYAALIDYGLANGIEEITEAEYIALLPPSQL